jgi:hypothetical protein
MIPQFIPGIFGGIADGGAFQQGPQTAIAQQSALAETHVFSPTLVNVARAGFNYLNTTRESPVAGDLGLPANSASRTFRRLRRTAACRLLASMGSQLWAATRFCLRMKSAPLSS